MDNRFCYVATGAEPAWQLFSARMDEYKRILHELMKRHRFGFNKPEDMDEAAYQKAIDERAGNWPDFDNGGAGLCSIVSDTAGSALRIRGIEASVVRGAYYYRVWAKPHCWMELSQGGVMYSIDLAHRQTGSPHMVKLIPGASERKHNLHRIDVVEPGRRSIAELSEMYQFGRLLYELHSLFGSP